MADDHAEKWLAAQGEQIAKRMTAAFRAVGIPDEDHADALFAVAEIASAHAESDGAEPLDITDDATAIALAEMAKEILNETKED